MNLHIHYSSASVRLPLIWLATAIRIISIKLIHCGTPRRDVLSDKMVCIQRQMMVRSKHVSYLLYGKYLKKNFFIPSSHWFLIELNLKTLWCNWRGSPQRPGRMKSIIQKRIIPAKTESQNERFLNQSTMWSMKVRSPHLLFVRLSRWAFKLPCYLWKLL